MSKKEETILTVTDNKIEDNVIKLCVVYSNVAYRGIIVTNSYIMLSTSLSSNPFTHYNDIASETWIEPIVFKGKGNNSLILEYALPKLSDVKLDDVNIIVKTYYIDSNGINRCDDHNAGVLVRTDNETIATYVDNVGHLLSGREILATFK